MKVEDEIELADIAKVAVQYLHKMVDDFQHDQLVIVFVDGSNKIKGGITTTNVLAAPVLNHIGKAHRPTQSKLTRLTHKFGLFLFGICNIPLCQAQFALAADQKQVYLSLTPVPGWSPLLAK
ncbi:hypothetical protein TcCL_ESM06633 [Trypanosoma cruzi]|nr:hypothetical protein TcCL_ESM06633 [Trypanosoma cruzi]